MFSKLDRAAKWSLPFIVAYLALSLVCFAAEYTIEKSARAAHKTCATTVKQIFTSVGHSNAVITIDQCITDKGTLYDDYKNLNVSFLVPQKEVPTK